MRRPQIPELSVYTGPMFSGKTENLEIELKKARIAGIRSIVFRSMKDTRTDRQVEVSICETVRISKALDVFDHLHEDHKLVAFDEIHFFEDDPDIVDVIMRIVRSGRRVLVAGLDLDYQERPFMVTARLMALAQRIYKLVAICEVCKTIDSASRSQRTSKSTDRFDVGSADKYEPRCLECYVPPNGVAHSHNPVSTDPLSS